MTHEGQALFYSVDSVPLYKKLESRLPELHPGLTFAFLGDTFAPTEREPWLPGQKREMRPTARLLYRWVPMEMHTTDCVRPALFDPTIDVALVLHFGRDVWQYAIRHQDCGETLGFHKALVQARIAKQNIRPPVYALRIPEDPRMRKADDEYFKDPIQRRLILESPNIEDQVLAISSHIRSTVESR